MKKNTHPKYKQLKVACSCGNKFTTRSTLDKDSQETLKIEICSACHPMYNAANAEKIIDTSGRVERFKGRYTNWSAALANSK